MVRWTNVFMEAATRMDNSKSSFRSKCQLAVNTAKLIESNICDNDEK